MFYRRKLLLGLLEAHGGKLEKLRLHKLLLIFSRRSAAPLFEFVPYHYGAFSFSANFDLTTLSRDGWLREKDSEWLLSAQMPVLAKLKQEHQAMLKALQLEFSDYSTEELVRYTYLHFPETAINSRIRDKVLGKSDAPVHTPSPAGGAFFTIGYEGKSLEGYLNLLIQNNVSLLADVRRNAYSMKYGFTGFQLRHACEGVGIQYLHLPALGIDSEKRQSLASKADYDLLFAGYEAGLQSLSREVEELAGLAKHHGRIAITCFEHSQCDCHRGRLAKHLEQLPGWNLPIVHL